MQVGFRYRAAARPVHLRRESNELAYAARPRGIVELGHIPPGLSLDDFGGFIRHPQGNFSYPTTGIDGLAELIPCYLALTGQKVLERAATRRAVNSIHVLRKPILHNIEPLT